MLRASSWEAQVIKAYVLYLRAYVLRHKHRCYTIKHVCLISGMCVSLPDSCILKTLEVLGILLLSMYVLASAMCVLIVKILL